MKAVAEFLIQFCTDPEMGIHHLQIFARKDLEKRINFPKFSLHIILKICATPLKHMMCELIICGTGIDSRQSLRHWLTILGLLGSKAKLLILLHIYCVDTILFVVNSVQFTYCWNNWLQIHEFETYLLQKKLMCVGQETFQVFRKIQTHTCKKTSHL